MKNLIRRIILKEWSISLSDNSGSILIITIWTLLFLSFFCLTLGRIISVKLNIAGHIKERVIAYYLAKAGVEAAIQVLDDDQTQYDSLNDAWSNNEMLFKEVKFLAGDYSVSYQSPEPKYGLIDEERKININTASKDTLAALLLMAGCSDSQAGQLANCIIDWRDKDSEPLAGGAEDGYYNSLAVPYNCKDAGFQSPEELLLVKDMNDEIFLKIKDKITVFGDGSVNINTAEKDILSAIGMGAALAEKVTAYRLGADGQEATSDDNVFESLGNIAEKLSLSEKETEIINSLTASHLITVTSHNFRVVSRGSVINAKMLSKIICIIRRDGVIKYWHQN